MKVISIRSLAIPGIKVIRFARFMDFRGYFTEPSRRSDLNEIDFLSDVNIVQVNESYSKPGTIRGLHFQWNPFMGKLVRTVSGRMVDLVLDIRKNSPTFGKVLAYNMPSSQESDYGEWIWVPPGFAHGNYFPEETIIEYFCSGEYSPNFEAGISPFSTDLDWSLCSKELKNEFDQIASDSNLITEKDRDGHSLESWIQNQASDNFVFNCLKP